MAPQPSMPDRRRASGPPAPSSWCHARARTSKGPRRGGRVVLAAAVVCIAVVRRMTGVSFVAPGDSGSPPIVGSRGLVEATARGGAVARPAVAELTDASLKERKDALKKGFMEACRTFFRPFEGAGEIFAEDIAFKDPVVDIKGLGLYKLNIQMLSGENFFGSLVISDGWIDLHSIEEFPDDPYKLRMRWTMGFTYRFAPWRPEALITGVSEFLMDSEGKIVNHRDYWDSTSLGAGGKYVPERFLAGVIDMMEPMLPPIFRNKEPSPLHSGVWKLLRKAPDYRIYRRPAGGRVFAIGAPGTSPSTRALAQALQSHGLTPGQELLVHTAGAGEVLPATTTSAGDFPQNEIVYGVALESPHPWDSEGPLVDE